MPAPGKPFDLFVSEESLCRHYAEQQVGISPQQATQNSTATGAVAGTALGAAAGGAIGAAFGAPGPGAAVGAGTGLLGGSAVGWNNGYGATWTIQRSYDIAYQQCMYAKGIKFLASLLLTCHHLSINHSSPLSGLSQTLMKIQILQWRSIGEVNINGKQFLARRH